MQQDNYVIDVIPENKLIKTPVVRRVVWSDELNSEFIETIIYYDKEKKYPAYIERRQLNGFLYQKQESWAFIDRSKPIKRFYCKQHEANYNKEGQKHGEEKCESAGLLVWMTFKNGLQNGIKYYYKLQGTERNLDYTPNMPLTTAFLVINEKSLAMFDEKGNIDPNMHAYDPLKLCEWLIDNEHNVDIQKHLASIGFYTLPFVLHNIVRHYYIYQFGCDILSIKP